MYEDFEQIQIERPKTHIKKDAWSITIPLADLYRDGWWITEIFGTDAVCVKRSSAYKTKRPYFCCIHLFLDTNQLTPKTKRMIQNIQNQHWKKYGPILTRPKK